MIPRIGIKRIPWFMYAIYDASIDSLKGGKGLPGGFGGASLNFITSDSVPTEVKDTKKLNYYEQQIPGGYTSIHKYGSASARMLSFKIELADFNEDFGLSKKLAQLDLLRRPELSIATKVNPPKADTAPSVNTTATNFISEDTRYNPFYGNPYVIMWHSTFDTSLLAYTVLKCDFTTSKPNRMGKPQYAIVDFELAEREDHPLSIVEHKLKKVLALFGAIGSVQNLIKNLKKANLPRNVYKDYKLKNFGF